MEHEYFMWLIRSIDPKHVISDDYLPVLEELYLIDFRWSNRFQDDENRAKDGLWLRHIFASERGIETSEIGIDWKRCSCLEMLIGIARRIEYEILAIPGEENVPKWFWRFIDSLGIGPYEDNVRDLNYVDERISLWLDRRYYKNGKGGIFIVNDSYFDMRKMTIWKQMNAVVNEVADF